MRFNSWELTYWTILKSYGVIGGLMSHLNYGVLLTTYASRENSQGIIKIGPSWSHPIYRSIIRDNDLDVAHNCGFPIDV